MEKTIKFAIQFEKLSDIESIEKKLKEVDFKYIWGFTGSLGLFKEKERNKYIKFLKENNLIIEQVHSLFNSEYDLSHLEDSKRDIFIEGVKKEIEKLKELDVRNYVIHCSGLVEGDRKERIKNFMDSLERILLVAEKVKMKIAIENIAFKQKVIGTAEEINKIINAFNSEYLGVCFDTGHANLSENPKKEFHLLKDKIFTFHIHDNDGMRDLHLPPPFGTFDWKWFIKNLKDIKQNILPLECIIPDQLGLKKTLKICDDLFNKGKKEFKIGNRIIKIL